MAERPRYIATSSRPLTSTAGTVKPKVTALTPTTPSNQSAELDYIREKARHARDYYTSVGLTNGDLITHQQAKEARRRSSSPDKARSSYNWKEPGSVSSYGKYGNVWKTPRSRSGSKDVDKEFPISYTLPMKTHTSSSIESKSRHSSTKSRSKSASCEANDAAKSKSISPVKPEKEADKERSPEKAFRTREDIEDGFIPRSSSLNRAGKLPHHQGQDEARVLNGLSRIDSHLHRSNTSLNSESAENLSNISTYEDLDKHAMPPPDPASTERAILYRNYKLERQRSNSDVQTEKRHSKSTDYLSTSFDAAHERSSKVSSRSFGSSSSLDHALSHDLMATKTSDQLSHSLPPSTKHQRKYKAGGSRGPSPSNSANASPRLPRKHGDKGIRSKSDVPDHKTILHKLNQSERDVVDGIRYDEERRRRHHFAHYDWQSMLFSFQDVLIAMESLKRKNTTTGASKAAALAASTDSLGSKGSSVSGSMEDMSIFIEEDEGLENNKYNELVSNCPFFRNEIGGDQDRVVCIAATGANSSSVSVQVGNNKDNTTIQARKVLTNQSFLSVVEGGCMEGLLPPGSPPSGSVSFGIENRDEGAYYYRLFFFDKEHQNFCGVDEKYGPVVISIRREKVDDPNHSGVYQYRVIVRTSELCTLRGSILEEAILQSSGKHGSSGKAIPAKELLEYLCPEINISCLRVAMATPKVHEQLVKVDEQNVYKTYKIGVLYCRARQTTEEDMYNNEKAGPAFTEFLKILGTKVKLNGFDDFRGGLDVKTDSTGTESVFTTFRDYKIMFHVSTMLPYTANNRQQLLRKRHIGNDIMTIIFQEPGSEPFNPKNMRSHFQHVFIVVRAYQPCTSETCYRVSVTRSRSIPRFGPPIPENCMFPKSASFREFLLTKIINGENIVHKAGKFKSMAMNTRQEYLRDFCATLSSNASLEGNPKFGRFPFAGASKRIRDNKDKQKMRPMPEHLSRGGLCWHVNVNDYNSSEIVPCLLGMSDCVLTVIEIASRQLIFSIPCQAILGWTVPPPPSDQGRAYKRDIHIYYGRGERLSVQTEDLERDEIVLRLERYTKGSETIYRQLHRNNRGELGFHVNYEGIVMDVDPNGNAFQDGLRQSSRLVEICMVAVATMTHDEIIDLLRTSKMVKVVAIPPNEDGTPRKCSMELYHLAPILDVKPAPEGITFQSFHDRSRSEPVPQSTSLPVRIDVIDQPDNFHKRSESYHHSNATKPKTDANRENRGIAMRDALGSRGKSRKSGKKSSKQAGNGDGKLLLASSAPRLAAVGFTHSYAVQRRAIQGAKAAKRETWQQITDSNGHSSASNTLSSTYSNLSSHSGADIDFAELEKHPTNGAALQCSSSLSTDSGLNSNNNSSSTLSRVSNETPTACHQKSMYEAQWEDSLHSLNQNSNNSVIIGSASRTSTAPSSDSVIRGVNWNSKPTKLSLGPAKEHQGTPHPSYAIDCTPTSEVNKSLRVYTAGTEAHKKASQSQENASAPATPLSHERLQGHLPIHFSQSIGPTLHNTPTKWRNPHQPRRRTVQEPPNPSNSTSSPRTKRKSATPHQPSRLRSSAMKSAAGGAGAPGTDIQNTLIRLLADSPTKQSPAKRQHTRLRESPLRVGSQRASPKRRTSSSDFSSDHQRPSHGGSPTRLRVIQRTVSDESLCGARPDNLLHSRQESPGKTDAPRALYSHQVSGSVDSLAPLAPNPAKGRRQPMSCPQPTNGNSPMLPLPDSTSWDRLLDAAKAAEEALTHDYLDHYDDVDDDDDDVFESSSIRSVSMGTLNDLGNDGNSGMTSSLDRNRAAYASKRTMSVENLYDHEFRGNQGDPSNLLRKREPPTPNARPSYDLAAAPLDFGEPLMMAPSGMEIPENPPSQSEERLERIELELRLLQDRLKKEQESKIKLEKEVSVLRRDNTILQRHVTQHHDPRRKRTKRRQKS